MLYIFIVLIMGFNCTLCVSFAILIFVVISFIGGPILLGFGIDNLIKYSDTRETACTVAIIDDWPIVLANFTISGVPMMSTINIEEHYAIGDLFLCYWYLDNKELSLYKNLSGPGILMTIFGSILLIIGIVYFVYVYNYWNKI